MDNHSRIRCHFILPLKLLRANRNISLLLREKQFFFAFANVCREYNPSICIFIHCLSLLFEAFETGLFCQTFCQTKLPKMRSTTIDTALDSNCIFCVKAKVKVKAKVSLIFPAKHFSRGRWTLIAEH